MMSDSSLSKQSLGSQEFSLVRTFDSPLESVWKAMTEADQLEEWWGPVGLENHVVKLDLQPGGNFFYSMQIPDGDLMLAKWVFREILPMQKLVYLLSFCDETEKPIRPPMSPNWPLEMLCTVTFKEEEKGKTEMLYVMAPWNATEQEHDTFDEGRDSMTQGFNSTWDQLEVYLSRTA